MILKFTESVGGWKHWGW